MNTVDDIQQYRQNLRKGPIGESVIAMELSLQGFDVEWYTLNESISKSTYIRNTSTFLVDRGV